MNTNGSPSRTTGSSTRSVVWYRRRPVGRSLLAPMAAAAALMVIGAPAAQSKGDDGPTQRVIVMAHDAKKADEHVKHSHGKTVDKVDVADSVTADVTDDQLADLQGDPQVTVIPNLPIDVQAVSYDGTRAPAAVFPQTTGSSSLVSNNVDGRGVGVA